MVSPNCEFPGGALTFQTDWALTDKMYTWTVSPQCEFSDGTSKLQNYWSLMDKMHTAQLVGSSQPSCGEGRPASDAVCDKIYTWMVSPHCQFSGGTLSIQTSSKLQGHAIHLNGFSPVWILRRRFNYPTWQKLEGHTVHLNGSPHCEF